MEIRLGNTDKHKNIYGKSTENKMENNDTKNFMWTTNFNFAYNNNKVLKEALREDA